MRIFCPAIVLSSSLLPRTASEVARRATPVALFVGNIPHPRGRACRLGLGATHNLLVGVGVAPDSPVKPAVELEGSPGSVRTQTRPPRAGEPVQWSSVSCRAPRRPRREQPDYLVRDRGTESNRGAHGLRLAGR